MRISEGFNLGLKGWQVFPTIQSACSYAKTVGDLLISQQIYCHPGRCFHLLWCELIFLFHPASRLQSSHRHPVPIGASIQPFQWQFSPLNCHHFFFFTGSLFLTPEKPSQPLTLQSLAALSLRISVRHLVKLGKELLKIPASLARAVSGHHFTRQKAPQHATKPPAPGADDWQNREGIDSAANHPQIPPSSLRLPPDVSHAPFSNPPPMAIACVDRPSPPAIAYW
jgi:hypothetical protein